MTSGLIMIAAGLIALWWQRWVPGEMARIRDHGAATTPDWDHAEFDRWMTPTLRIVRPLITIAGLAAVVLGILELAS